MGESSRLAFTKVAFHGVFRCHRGVLLSRRPFEHIADVILGGDADLPSNEHWLEGFVLE